MRPSVWQIVVIVVILLLIFSWRRLPDMARSVGQSLRIFKSEVDQMTDKDKDKDGGSSAAAGETVSGERTDPQRPAEPRDAGPDPVSHEHPDPTRRPDGPAPRG